MAEYVTLRERIDELVERHGTLRATARVLMTDCGYLHRLRAGEKTEPGDPLLRRMGLREVRTYERTHGVQATSTPNAERCRLLDELIDSWIARGSEPALTQRRINARLAIEAAWPTAGVGGRDA